MAGPPITNTAISTARRIAWARSLACRIGLRSDPARRKVLPIHPALGGCGFIAAAGALSLMGGSGRQPDTPAADKDVAVLMTVPRPVLCHWSWPGSTSCARIRGPAPTRLPGTPDTILIRSRHLG